MKGDCDACKFGVKGTAAPCEERRRRNDYHFIRLSVSVSSAITSAGSGA